MDLQETAILKFIKLSGRGGSYSLIQRFIIIFTNVNMVWNLIDSFENFKKSGE